MQYFKKFSLVYLQNFVFVYLSLGASAFVILHRSLDFLLVAGQLMEMMWEWMVLRLQQMVMRDLSPTNKDITSLIRYDMIIRYTSQVSGFFEICLKQPACSFFQVISNRYTIEAEKKHYKFNNLKEFLVRLINSALLVFEYFNHVLGEFKRHLICFISFQVLHLFMFDRFTAGY